MSPPLGMRDMRNWLLMPAARSSLETLFLWTSSYIACSGGSERPHISPHIVGVTGEAGECLFCTAVPQGPHPFPVSWMTGSKRCQELGTWEQEQPGEAGPPSGDSVSRALVPGFISLPVHSHAQSCSGSKGTVWPLW